MTNEKNYIEKLIQGLFKQAFPETIEEAKFEEQTLEDGTVIQFENLEVGTVIYVVVEGEDPKPMAAGEITLADGKKITVDEAGAITEVMDPEATEEVVEEEMAEEAPVTETVMSFEELQAKLPEYVAMDKNGYANISFQIKDGQVINPVFSIYEDEMVEIQAKKEKDFQSEIKDLKLAKEKSEKEWEAKFKAQQDKFVNDLKELGEKFSKQMGRSFSKAPEAEEKVNKPLTRTEQLANQAVLLRQYNKEKSTAF